MAIGLARGVAALMLAAAAGAALAQAGLPGSAQPGDALPGDPTKAPPAVSEKLLPPLPRAERLAPPAVEAAPRSVPRWRNSGTWRDEYDPRHDAYRLGVFGNTLQPDVNATQPHRWGSADPRTPPAAPGAARQDRFAVPQEWGDEGGWDRGIWPGSSRRP